MSDDFDWADAGEASGVADCDVGCGTMIFLGVLAIAFLAFAVWFLLTYA